MKYLNERITFTFSGQDVTMHTTGTYTYYIQRGVRNGNPKNMFVGNFFYNGTDTAITFDVTDIIASDGWVPSEDNFEGGYGGTLKKIPNRIVNKYRMQITWNADDHDFSVSSFEWVAKVYKYNNKIMNQFRSFFDPNDYNTTTYRILLQGFTYAENQDSVLVPHYPMYSEEQGQEENECPFGLSLLVGNNITGLTSSFEIGGSEELSFNFPCDDNSCSILGTVSDVATYRDIVPVTDGVLYIQYGDRPLAIKVIETTDPEEPRYIYVRYPSGDNTLPLPGHPYAFAYVNNSEGKTFSQVDLSDIDTTDLIFSTTENPSLNSTLDDGSAIYEVEAKQNSNQVSYKAAIFDVCPKRYYLFWQDRWGSFQCQPFNDYTDYSEGISRTEIKDYRDRRRNYNIQVQPKWSLNSGWITEELYPYYESIYTSPILILFDVKMNTAFTVMVSGDYTEKTYRKEKKMINMSLELQENKKENHIY